MKVGLGRSLRFLNDLRPISRGEFVILIVFLTSMGNLSLLHRLQATGKQSLEASWKTLRNGKFAKKELTFEGSPTNKKPPKPDGSRGLASRTRFELVLPP